MTILFQFRGLEYISLINLSKPLRTNISHWSLQLLPLDWTDSSQRTKISMFIDIFNQSSNINLTLITPPSPSGPTCFKSDALNISVKWIVQKIQEISHLDHSSLFHWTGQIHLRGLDLFEVWKQSLNINLTLFSPPSSLWSSGFNSEALIFKFNIFSNTDSKIKYLTLITPSSSRLISES